MKNIATLKHLACALAAATLTTHLLAGCVSSSKVQAAPGPTVGQQLTDLEKARQSGAITDKEYERLKKAIINKND